MRRLPALLALALVGAAPPLPPRQPIRQPVRHPMRIVSLNLCADQLLLALADRDQIAALTQYARDPQMSAAARDVGDTRTIHGSAEEVLVLHPDLIVSRPGRRRETAAQLRGHHIATLDLVNAKSYRDIVRNVRQVAAAVGHPERGNALIARMDRDLASVPQGAGRGATAAYYQRRGYLTGTGTLVDDLMRRVGLRNLATQLGKPALARLGLEQLVAARPDYLIVESDSDRVIDQGTELLHHPLLAAIPRLKLPQAWTVCGGPAYPRAAHALAAQLRGAGR